MTSARLASRVIAGLGLKKPGEIARAHCRTLGEIFHRMIRGGMGYDPRLQLANIIAVLGLGKVKRAELSLPPGPAEKNHHRAGNKPGNVAAKVFFDQGQSQVNSRGDPPEV